MDGHRGMDSAHWKQHLASSNGRLGTASAARSVVRFWLQADHFHARKHCTDPCHGHRRRLPDPKDAERSQPPIVRSPTGLLAIPPTRSERVLGDSGLRATAQISAQVSARSVRNAGTCSPYESISTTPTHVRVLDIDRCIGGRR